ncbi:MAG: DNA polymerase I [Alphaproteobacteria bacterium]
MAQPLAKTEPKARKIGPGDRVTLIDGSGYIFRAYHALPPLTRKSDGLPVGAVAGFCNMLYKLLEDGKKGDKPTHLAVIFDKSEHTFRNELYSEYKAHRPPAPEDLIPQFPLIREATRAFGVPSIEMSGYEADDLIGTYAREAAEAGANVTIISSDKDLMQLVNDKIQLYDTMKDKRIGRAEVIERFGVPPEKVIEVQALAGDSVDNVPGVPGIGVKTAAELINEFGDLETLLSNAEKIKQPKRRENLLTNADKARISKKLVTLDCNVPLEVPLEDLAVEEIHVETLISFLKGMEFAALTRRVAQAHGLEDVGDIDAKPIFRANGPHIPAPVLKPTGDAPPGAVFEREAVLRPIDHKTYKPVLTLEDLDQWLARAQESGTLALSIETTSDDPMNAEICGIALATGPGHACYIPILHGRGDGLDLEGGARTPQLSLRDVLARLREPLADPSIVKIGQNLKRDALVLSRHDVAVEPIDDVMLMSYSLDSALHGHGVDELSELHLSHKAINSEDVVGKGKAKRSFDCVPIEQATAYASEAADISLRLAHLLRPELIKRNALTVYETLERPLVPVLAAMEKAGVKIDSQMLRQRSGDFAQRMGGLEAEAYKIAGFEFNLGSPKQISEILFEKMNIGGGKKTKTGAYTTSADVLEELAAQGHELPQVILDWRQLSKLKSTYTDALPGFVNKETGRVHTSYSLAATTTGRLSSNEPNLQNIPIRTREGKELRKAFIAEKGMVLISADYSQVELRIFAHMANIPELKAAFQKGQDIHRMTASEMFGIPADQLDDETRSRAKAINFGIIYGISAFGLANQLRIPREEAGAYIKTYFERFPGIRDYMERTKKFARDNGYVESLFGRKMHIKEIASKIPGLRANAERQAINAPIQGTAADVIRRAMVRIPSALEAKRLKAKMLLQIHDELIFECPQDEAGETCAVVKAVMERATEPAVKMDVALMVEANAGPSWADVH